MLRQSGRPIDTNLAYVADGQESIGPLKNGAHRERVDLEWVRRLPMRGIRSLNGSLQSSGAVLVCVAPVRVAGLSGIRAGKLPGSGALQSLAAKDSAGGAVSRPGGRGRPSPCGAFAPVSV